MQNLKGAIDHLKNHQKYPATKAELLAECDSLSDFLEEDKKMFSESLPVEPEGGYKSAEEVMTALGWEEPKEE